jgi:ferrous iron transport protein A
MTLKDLRVGQSARVAGFAKGNDKSYRKKLLSMGLTPDTPFSVMRVAPMGDPIEIAVRGFSLSLRGDEAASLLVEAA